MLSVAIKKLMNKEDLSAEECTLAMEQVLQCHSPEQSAAFLTLMRSKGETVVELLACLNVLKKYQISLPISVQVCDIVGTGGDGYHTVNISSAAAILAAATGVSMVKHGNRSASSQSGSADVLEALGLELNAEHQSIVNSVHHHGIGFCYAPAFHPALAAVKGLRSRLKVPTLFNVLGPLLNPASAAFMILGVYDKKLMNTMAELLIATNIKGAMVVHGSGLDELNCIGPCDVIEIKNGEITVYQLDPILLGLSPCTHSDLRGGAAHYNADRINELLSGERSPIRDTCILNAAAAVYITGYASTMELAIEKVSAAIDSGAARQTLAAFIHASGGQ